MSGLSSNRPPFYELLEIDTTASEDEITQQFKQLVKKHHPDQGGTQDSFIRLKIAYDTLSSATERRRYDRLGHAEYVQQTNAKRWMTEEQQNSEDEHDKRQDAQRTQNTGTNQQSRSHQQRQTESQSKTEKKRRSDSTQQQTTSSSTTERGYRRSKRSSNRSRGSSGFERENHNSYQRYQTRYSDPDETSSTDNNNSQSQYTETQTGRWKTQQSEADSSFTLPWILIGFILTYLLSVPIQIVSSLSAEITAALAVVLGFGSVSVVTVYSAINAETPLNPQLLPQTALSYAGVCAVGTVLITVAVAQGSLNGGLVLARFTTILMSIPLLILAAVLFGFLTGVLQAGPLLGGGLTLVLVGSIYASQFTPYGNSFLVDAIVNEPSTTIAPWVSVGAISSDMLILAVNVTLSIILGISVTFGVLFLLIGFSGAMRGSKNCKASLQVVGWEVIAGVPFVILAWWHLSGNNLWMLYGAEPPSQLAAAVLLSVCIWPTVIFSQYALFKR